MSLLHTPQGVHSRSFKPPPVDHDLSVPGLYEYHAQHSPTHPVFAYSELETGLSTTVTYREAWKSICAVTRWIVRHCDAKSPANGGARPVIAVLAQSDTISYMYMQIAIMALGFTAFPMAPRNGAAATAKLIQQTGAKHMFVSADTPTQALAQEVSKLLMKESTDVQVLPMVAFEDMKEDSDDQTDLAITTVNVEEDDVVLLLHSSGTTAFPKPITCTKRRLNNWVNIPCYGEVDLCGKRVATHTNPAFHAMGVATYIWPLSSGMTSAVYPPKMIIPTPTNFLEHWTADKCDIVFCVPVFIEAWAQASAKISKLKALDAIVFSGASVNKAIGDMLAEAGVVMHPFWGSTEIGPATMFIPCDLPPPGEWDYFKFSRHIEFAMQPHELLEGIFEPVLIPTETCFPHATNTTTGGNAAFAVGDYLERHPTDPARWRVFGRKDDQIMLSTGENVNPVPIEAAISQDKYIASALMFGSNRMSTGVLVEPIPGLELGQAGPQQLEMFKDLIWSTIEHANSIAPAFARIRKEMVVTTSQTKPLERTPKGTPRRPVCLSLYADEIEALYATEAAPLVDREFPDRA